MFESAPQGWQILRERAVLTDFRPPARAMEITAGADQQTELASQDGQTAHLLGGLVSIDHFDRVASCLNIVGNQAAALAASEFVMPGVGQTDPGLGRAQGFDGFFQGRPVLLDVPELAGAEPFAERFGAILSKTFANHPVGKVRPGRCIATVAQFLLDLPRAFERPRHALQGQFATYFF